MVEEIAERVKVIRHKLGLSQREFAKKVGATFVSVWKWENNKSKPHPIFVGKMEELNEENNGCDTSL
jgi:transcriptional regulator with XRE-family HTH domain